MLNFKGITTDLFPSSRSRTFSWRERWRWHPTAAWPSRTWTWSLAWSRRRRCWWSGTPSWRRSETPTGNTAPSEVGGADGVNVVMSGECWAKCFPWGLKEPFMVDYVRVRWGWSRLTWEGKREERDTKLISISSAKEPHHVQLPTAQSPARKFKYALRSGWGRAAPPWKKICLLSSVFLLRSLYFHLLCSTLHILLHPHRTSLSV